VTVTTCTGRKSKTISAKKTKKASGTEDDTSEDEGAYDSTEEEDYELEESKEESKEEEEESESEDEGDVSTAEPNIDDDDEVEDHQDAFPTFIYYEGRSKRGREPGEANEGGEADEAGGQSQRPRARPRYIPGM